MKEVEFNLSWGEACEAMEAGKLVARKHWIDDGSMVLCLRPYGKVSEDFVPNIKTLPDALKTFIQETGKGDVHFENGYCVYYTNARTISSRWQPKQHEEEAADWGIIGE